MIIGKVVGNVWATKKDEKMGGYKLLVIKVCGNGDSETIVAVDTIGAGIGEDVLTSEVAKLRKKNLYETKKTEKEQRLEKAIFSINNKFPEAALRRGRLLGEEE